MTTKLTAISTSLLHDMEQSGAVTLGTYAVVADPNTQTLNVSGVIWTADQWTAAGPQSSPFLAYHAVADDTGNADGIRLAEETFLIRTNITIKIRKANTLDSFFGHLSTNFGRNNAVYIWNPGASPSPPWDAFQFAGGQWTTV